MNAVNIGGYKRISKIHAKNLFNAGVTIRAVPCKYRPDNAFMAYDACKFDTDNKFGAWVNEVEYYNCNYEAGYYVAFYVKECNS